NEDRLLFVHQTELPASLYSMKYYHHKVGDQRGADRPAEDRFALTMLVSRGCWRQRIWSDSSGQSVEVLLQEPGDFIACGPALNHSWSPVQPSTMLTVKWSRLATTGALPHDQQPIGRQQQ